MIKTKRLTQDNAIDGNFRNAFHERHLFSSYNLSSTLYVFHKMSFSDDTRSVSCFLEQL